MERRTVLRASLAGGGAAALSGSLWVGAALAAPAQPGPSPYGPPGAADANGIQLPTGFTSRVIARSRQAVGGTGYAWHDAPDGGACFAAGAGWIYVSNSEITGTGGASAVRFNADGSIASAYRILSNTNRNCAGGATPWGTWLSCEEVGPRLRLRDLPAGRHRGGAPAGDGPLHARGGRGRPGPPGDLPDRGRDRTAASTGSGPTTWGNLSAGTLEVLVAGTATSGPVTWAPVPDPDGSPTRTRNQVAGAKRFNGGEGCYYAGGTCWFTTKGDNRVWAYDAVNQRIDLAYDDSLVTGGARAADRGRQHHRHPPRGDLFVAEDGGNMEINVITPAGVVAPFLRITGQGVVGDHRPGVLAGRAAGSTSPRSAAPSGIVVRRHHLRGARPVPDVTSARRRSGHHSKRFTGSFLHIWFV